MGTKNRYGRTLILVAVAAGLVTADTAKAEPPRGFGKGSFSYTNSLELLPVAKQYKRKRFSSYDRTGGNKDSLKIPKGETVVLAETKSAGCIRHIWCTIGTTERDGPPKTDHYLRKLVLRMYWDGSKKPSVEVPIGDFFGSGHGIRRNYVSAPFQMSSQNGAAFNCWFPMPFAKGARIELVNQCEKDKNIIFYYYIDWEQYAFLEDNVYRFHASWNRVTTKGSSPEKGLGTEEFQSYGKNTTGKDNYVILEAKGRGHYVGCNINIHNQRWSWYWDWPGEGDDMIFVDGETWPPDIHGTGTEDYVNHAYCPIQRYEAPYHGIISTGGVNWRKPLTYYRYHIPDPIPFTKSIRVTIEHGHNNMRYDDWSSTAYWYQKGIGDIRRLPPPEQRLPLETKLTWKGIFAYLVLWPIYRSFYVW